MSFEHHIPTTFLPARFVWDDLTIHDNGYVHCKHFNDRIAHWWRHGDKEVSVDYSIRFIPGCSDTGSFTAINEREVKEGLLKILNHNWGPNEQPKSTEVLQTA